MAGLLLLYKKKRTFWILGVLLLLATLSYAVNVVDKEGITFFNFLKLAIYFTFHIIVTKALIFQIWNAKSIDEKSILGLISGYISLGFIGFFMLMSAEMFEPDSFNMLDNGISIVQNLMYFSYVTLLTIGYGDITPVNGFDTKNNRTYWIIWSNVFGSTYSNCCWKIYKSNFKK